MDLKSAASPPRYMRGLSENKLSFFLDRTHYTLSQYRATDNPEIGLIDLEVLPRLVRRLRHHRLLRDGVAEERGSHPGATAAGSDVTSGRVVRGLVGGVAFLFFGADKDLRDGGVWIGGGVVGLEEGGECMGGNGLAE